MKIGSLTRWVSRGCVVAGLTLSATAVHAAPQGAAVYVTSQPPVGASDDEVAGLADAARELRDAIAHRKNLRVVDDPAAADVRVEVTNREQRDAGEGGFGGIKLTPLGEMIIRFHAKLTPPHVDEADLKGIGPGYWSRAAKDGAERLEKWIADHQAPHKGAPISDP